MISHALQLSCTDNITQWQLGTNVQFNQRTYSDTARPLWHLASTTAPILSSKAIFASLLIRHRNKTNRMYTEYENSDDY
jgi:hypothetical protein